MKKLADFLGKFFGFLTIMLYAFLFLNAMIDFNVPAEIMSILLTVKFYALFVVCGIAGYEFVAGKKIFAFLYLIVLAFVVIFSFFPDISDQISDIVTNM